ncbi:succinate dehydrogenase cytochrome b subunit [Aquihabitans daechungensis]|uniref:succinate dehydrogenase cytochrome b subunit n=1 Tax=Aquihabitans daechungensis TaxID=1052257 RepID=UPI003BA35D71
MASTTVARGASEGGAPRAKRKAPLPVEFYRSALGKKYVMAITGIMLMGFVFFHMVGNLKMYVGAEDFDHYAEFLRQILVPILPPTAFLWILRIGLIGAFALHIHSAYALTRMNHAARTVKYQSPRDYQAANFASRTMRWSGVIVGLFLIWHLFDLSWTGTPGMTFVRGAAYANVVSSLSRPLVAAFYVAANIALGFHLFHGAWSLFQSMGWNNPKFNSWRRNFAAVFAAIIVVGNCSFPIAVQLGIVSN